MITAMLRICVDEKLKAEVDQLLRTLIEPTRAEPGCVSCRLYHEFNDPNVVTWIEEWRAERDLKRRLNSQQFKKVLAALDMSSMQPEIRFDTVVHTAGMQLIEEARGVPTSD